MSDWEQCFFLKKNAFEKVLLDAKGDCLGRLCGARFELLKFCLMACPFLIFRLGSYYCDCVLVILRLVIEEEQKERKTKLKKN